MSKTVKTSNAIMALILFVLMFTITTVSAAEYSGPTPLQPQLSSDGNTVYNATPAIVVRVDPNPPPGQASMPMRFDVKTLQETATTTFIITYVANGGADLWGQPCFTVPEDAKAAFNAAAAIWGNLLQSSVPITIKACWATLASPTILGYSGGGPIHRDFTGAPLANTWYGGALANALAGSDLDPASFDMHITYNSNFAWYYGTDSATPSGQYDLMSVVLHEIAHGLNFSGSMSYLGGTGGTGSWGYGTGYPNVYDTFMRDGTADPGNRLVNTGIYPNPSAALGSALISNNIFFHGINAMTANGGQRVKMYAPDPWEPGSSYSHLDYLTFRNGADRLMVYAISSGVSTHDPGPVTLGIFKDMGWTTEPPAPDIQLSNGVALNQTVTASVSQGTWRYFYIDVPSGMEKLVIDLYNMTANLDLYVQQGSKPTLSSYSGGTSSESCTVTSPTAGRWWIGVNNYDTGTISYTVKARWSKGKGLPWLLLLLQ
jgi:hypothetical protein